MAYYGEPPQSYGYYGEPLDPTLTGYGEATQQYLEPRPLDGYYGEPEMPGYAHYESPQAYPGVAYYGDPYLAGYMRETQPTYNAGCPMPTNVAGFAAVEPLEGYVKPSSVNAACDQFVPQPDSPSTSEFFKPLW